MKLYHVISGSTDTLALQAFPDKSLNIMLPASALHIQNRWKRELPLIKKKAKSIFADSGILGWIRRLGPPAWAWAEDVERVLEIQLQVDPDIVAAVDIPSEPNILEHLGQTAEAARMQTINNAQFLINRKSTGDPRLQGKRIAISIQGYTLDDYDICIRDFRKLGFFDLDPDQFIFAIGSVCMRKPPGLYEVVKFVCERIPTEFLVHCYGIAKVEWVLQLQAFGVRSCDSATAATAGAYCKIVETTGRQIRIEAQPRDTLLTNCMRAVNIASMELQLRESLYPAQAELFNDVEGQLEQLEIERRIAE